jgi:hypothetical protein
MNEFFEQLGAGDLGANPGGALSLIFMLLMSFIFGQLIATVYVWTNRSLSYSSSFTTSLVTLPVIVTLMMTLIAGQLVVAFGLLAVFAVVRFRNVLKDTRDTTFLAWAIVEGMAVGTMRFSTALIGAIATALLFLYLSWSNFGIRSRYNARLRLVSRGRMSDEELQQRLKDCVWSLEPTSEHQMADDQWEHYYLLRLLKMSLAKLVRQRMERWERIESVTVELVTDEPGI